MDSDNRAIRNKNPKEFWVVTLTTQNWTHTWARRDVTDPETLDPGRVRRADFVAEGLNKPLAIRHGQHKHWAMLGGCNQEQGRSKECLAYAWARRDVTDPETLDPGRAAACPCMGEGYLFQTTSKEATHLT